MKTIKKIMKSYLFNIFLVVGLTSLVLWLTLRKNYHQIIGLLTNISWAWLALIIASAIFYQVIIGWIITRITKKSNPQYRYRQGIVNAFVASFFSGITPSATGGQFGQVYVFKKQGIQISDSASVLWMDFILYQSTMVGFVLVLLILKFHYFYSNFSQLFILVIFGFIINSVIIVGLWSLATFPKVYTWISTTGIRIGHKLKIVKNKEHALKLLDEQLQHFDGEIVHLKSNKLMMLEIIMANILRLFIYFAIPFLCAKAIGVTVTLDMLLNIVSLSAFVSMINCFIPIPGASGGTEATFILMFSTIFGKIASSGIMILWRLFTYYLIMIIGGIVFLVVRLKDKI